MRRRRWRRLEREPEEAAAWIRRQGGGGAGSRGGALAEGERAGPEPGPGALPPWRLEWEVERDLR